MNSLQMYDDLWALARITRDNLRELLLTANGVLGMNKAGNTYWLVSCHWLYTSLRSLVVVIPAILRCCSGTGSASHYSPSRKSSHLTN